SPLLDPTYAIAFSNRRYGWKRSIAARLPVSTAQPSHSLSTTERTQQRERRCRPSQPHGNPTRLPTSAIRLRVKRKTEVLAIAKSISSTHTLIWQHLERRSPGS